MAKILKITDRIPLKIDDIEFKLAPLTFLQKMEIQEHMAGAGIGNLKEAMQGAAKAIKYSIKDVRGIEDYEGNSYTLEFDDSGFLTDGCVDNLLNLQQSEKLIAACAAMLSGLPDKELLDPRTGEKLEGISFGEVQGN